MEPKVTSQVARERSAPRSTVSSSGSGAVTMSNVPWASAPAPGFSGSEADLLAHEHHRATAGQELALHDQQLPDERAAAGVPVAVVLARGAVGPQPAQRRVQVRHDFL